MFEFKHVYKHVLITEMGGFDQDPQAVRAIAVTLDHSSIIIVICVLPHLLDKLLWQLPWQLSGNCPDSA